jgi:hypothetical protein
MHRSATEAQDRQSGSGRNWRVLNRRRIVEIDRLVEIPERQTRRASKPRIEPGAKLLPNIRWAERPHVTTRLRKFWFTPPEGPLYFF